LIAKNNIFQIKYFIVLATGSFKYANGNHGCKNGIIKFKKAVFFSKSSNDIILKAVISFKINYTDLRQFLH